MNPIRVAAPLAVVLLLAGCGMMPPAPEPAASTPAASESPTPVDTPEPEPARPAMPDLTGTEVVLVTAQFSAPNGALLDVAMTSYYPVAIDSPEGLAILATLDAAGDTTPVSDAAALAADGAILQLSAITVTDASPGTAWPAGLGPTPRFGPGLAETTIGLPLGTDTLGWPLITEPGSGWGVSAISYPEASPTPLTAWADFWTFYGFDLRSFDATATSCDTVLTALAQESRSTDAWEQSTYGCTVGIGH